MNKKKILIIVFIVFCCAAMVSSVFFLLRRVKNVLPSLTYGVIEKNNYKFDDVSPVIGGYEYYLDDKVGFISESGDLIIEPKYDGVILIDRSFLAFCNEDEKYVFDVKGNLLLKATGEVYTLTNIVGNDYFEISKNGDDTVYDYEGNKVYSGTAEIDFFIDKIFVTETYYYDVSNAEKVNYLEYYVSGDYIYFDLGKGKYDIYDSINKKWIKNKEWNEDKELLGNNYYIDYSVCRNGGYLYDTDDNVIINSCASFYDVSYVDKGIIIYVLGEEVRIVFKDKTVSVSSYDIYGDYIALYYEDANKVFYDFSGNKVNLSCNITGYFNEKYICDDGINEFIVDKDFKELTDKYVGITCNDYLCAIENDKHMYALYKDDLISDFKYYDVFIGKDSAIGFNMYSMDVLKLGNAVDVIDINEDSEEIGTLDDLKILELINLYKLDDIKEDILADKELFSLYASTALENENLKDYMTQILLMFKVVLDNKEFIDVRYLLNNLARLNIVETDRLSVAGAAGTYDDFSKQVNLLETTDRVLLHELMHFVDYNINIDNFNIYQCGDSSFNLRDVDGYAYVNNVSCKSKEYFKKFIVEAGAEYYTGYYINKKLVTSYDIPVTIYGLLSNIYGIDKMKEVYFAKDGYYKFYNLLRESGLSDSEVYDFLEKASYLVNISSSNKDEVNVAITDYLIRIINNNNWYEDGYYKYVISMVLRPSFSGLISKELPINFKTDYSDDYSKILPLEKKALEIINKVDSKYFDSIIKNGVLYDGSGYYVTIVVNEKDEGINFNTAKYLLVKYDFINDKVLEYKLYPYNE